MSNLIKATRMIHAVEIHANSRTPKYKQLAHNLSRGIKSRTISKEAPLPSTNQLSSVLEVSRDTVEKAYRELRRKDLIETIPGKGYFVKADAGTEKMRVLVLFNNMSAHKKTIYDHFVKDLGQQVEIDFHVYNNDFQVGREIGILSYNAPPEGSAARRHFSDLHRLSTHWPKYCQHGPGKSSGRRGKSVPADPAQILMTGRSTDCAEK